MEPPKLTCRQRLQRQKVNCDYSNEQHRKEFEDYKLRKKELNEKLRELQARRQAEGKVLLEKVAHINVLSKEYKNMNNDLVKTDNEFNGMYKKFMMNFGKGSWNKKQLERVQLVHERMHAGADRDFAKDMG